MQQGAISRLMIALLTPRSARPHVSLLPIQPERESTMTFKPHILCLLGFLCLIVNEGTAQYKWVQQYPFRESHSMHAVEWIDTATAIAVGEFGIIRRTSDGGTSWTV